MAVCAVAMLAGCSASGAADTDAAPSTAVSRPSVAPTSIGPTFARLAAGAECPVTRAEDRPSDPPAVAVGWNKTPDNLYGAGGLWVALPDWPASRDADGTYRLKFGWYRENEGRLSLRAKSMESGEHITVEVEDGYGNRGFQPTVLPLTRTGCWLVTGRLGATEVRFVMDVAVDEP